MGFTINAFIQEFFRNLCHVRVFTYTHNAIIEQIYFKVSPKKLIQCYYGLLLIAECHYWHMDQLRKHHFRTQIQLTWGSAHD